MINRTFEAFRLAEARGQIKEGTAAKVAVAAILESAAATFYKVYYGGDYSREADSVAKAENTGIESLGTLKEAMLTDITSTQSVLREAHATTDFPIVLANLRARVMRDSYMPSDSILPSLAAPRPVSDFKLIRGLKITGVGDLTEQAEGESVDYTTFGYSEDAYNVVLLSRAIKLTYQLIKNDDIGVITRGMEELGLAARRARALACARAIKRDLPSTVLDGVGAGTPTIPRLEAAYQVQAERTREVDGEVRPAPRLINGIIVPPSAAMTAKTSLKSSEVYTTGDKVPKANPVEGLGDLTVDLIFAEILGKDWLVFNKGVRFLELAILDDFKAGPRTVTKLPNVVQDPQFGDFDDNTSAVKVMDACGAKVISVEDALRIKGA